MATENFDVMIGRYLKVLAQTEEFLSERAWPLDALIELSQRLHQVSIHMAELRMRYPKENRFVLLDRRCEIYQSQVLDRADEAARLERFATGASVH